MNATTETVHRFPTDGSKTMPCCGQSTLTAAGNDRITGNDRLVTCDGAR